MAALIVAIMREVSLIKLDFSPGCYQRVDEVPAA